MTTFGRLLASDADRFAEWMEQEDVRAGAEELIVLLAYLDRSRQLRISAVMVADAGFGFWLKCGTLSSFRFRES
jgi:hypothetical protein